VNHSKDEEAEQSQRFLNLGRELEDAGELDHAEGQRAFEE